MVKAVVVLFLAALLAGCANAREASTPAPAGEVVPWLPLPANLTSPSQPPGPEPLPPGTPPCQANDLVGTWIGRNGATGHFFTGFGFAGLGPGSCYLDGTPSVGLLDSKGRTIPFRQHGPFLPPLQPGRTLVEPGQAPTPQSALKLGQAGLEIDWVTQPEACSPGAHPVVPTDALIAIPAGGVMDIRIPPEPAAYVCQGLGVGAFEGPYVPVEASSPPALPAVSLNVPRSVRVGQSLQYLVTLKNTGNHALDLVALCPTFEEELFADLVNGSPPLGGKHIYSLNCGPVGDLKTGAAATFQMIFKVPGDAAPGTYTLVFMLGYWNAMTSDSKVAVTINR